MMGTIDTVREEFDRFESRVYKYCIGLESRSRS